MLQLNFKEEVKKLFNFAQNFKKFEENPGILLEEIKNFNIDDIERQRSKFSNYISSLNMPSVINFIRYVVLDKILNNQSISIDRIIEMKDNISNKNLEYFNDYPRFKDALNNRPDKPIGEKWHPYSILYQIYYNVYKNQIKTSLNYLQTVLNDFLDNEAPEIQGNWAVKVMDFRGARNYGASEIWFAFYPELLFNDHKDAYQIFLGIYHDIIQYGIGRGSNIKKFENFDEIKQREEVTIQEFELDRMKEFILKVFSDFKNLNQELINTEPKSKTSTTEKIYVSKVPKNIILYGPPGTGKTFLSRKIAVDLIEKSSYSLDVKSEEIDWNIIKDKYEKYKGEERIKFITFHQAYSYEEFIQGYRYKDNKVLLKDGIFKKFIDHIHNKGDYERNYVFIIDEINRGNISKIFGEVITIIEDDKRLNASNETEVILPNTKITSDSKEEEQRFIIPANLFIIGTMNTADRSIALIDIALRRRFHFEGLYPDSEIIKNELIKSIDSLEETINSEIFDINDIEKLQKIFEKLNKRIEVLLDRDHMIGHSYFLKVISNQDLFSLWYGKILPLLNEYLYNDWDRLKVLLGVYNEGEKKGFIQDLNNLYKDIFEEEGELDFPYKFVDYKGQKEQFLEILGNTYDIE